MTSLTESSTDTAQDTQNAATAVSENLIEHPRGAEPGKPGRRDAFYFEQKNRLPDAADGKGRGGARYGRTGIIHTPHGDIHTPAFVPVATQAAMKAVLPETMKDLGAQCLLSNAFHLYERPGEQVLDEAGGLAKFMNWNGPTFTDSGGFQVLSLGAGFKKTLAMDVTGMKSDDVIAEGKERLAFVDEDGVTFKSPLNGSLHRFSAEISMGIQHKIGADIMFAFDELTTLMNTRGYQERSVERTYRWAQRCVAEHKRLTEERVGKPYQALYGGRTDRFVGFRRRRYWRCDREAHYRRHLRLDLRCDAGKPTAPRARHRCSRRYFRMRREWWRHVRLRRTGALRPKWRDFHARRTLQHQARAIQA